MMRSFSKGRSVRFCRKQIEPAIDLKRVRADNFCVDVTGDIGRQFGFAGCSWASDKERALHPITPGRFLFLAGRLNDLGEAARVKAGPADEGAVDVRLAYEFARVLWFDAAAVLNTHTLGGRIVSHFAQSVTYKSMGFLRLLWRSVAPGANRPDRLVRDHCFLQFLWAQTSETAAQLDCQYFFNVSFVALLESFADANNRTQCCVVRCADFPIDDFIGLAKQGAAFAVPKHDVMHKQVAQKCSADLACKRPILFPIHVLRTDLDVLCIPKRFGHFCNCRKRRNDYHFNIGDFAYVPKQQRLHKSRRFSLRHVHLPVGGHYFLTHQFLSVSAATPGSSLPSSNSSEAPPPVEINVILSARPACLTAVTESPPPIIVVAPDCAIASAIAIVPSPNSGISKTPMGPFHKIVSALAISSW